MSWLNSSFKSPVGVIGLRSKVGSGITSSSSSSSTTTFTLEDVICWLLAALKDGLKAEVYGLLVKEKDGVEELIEVLASVEVEASVSVVSSFSVVVELFSLSSGYSSSSE